MKTKIEVEGRGSKVEGISVRKRFGKSGLWVMVLGLGVSGGVLAQVPDAPPALPAAPAAPTPASPAPASNASKAPGLTPSSSFLGKDAPAFDPGSELLSWDGKSWNVNNNRIFLARFEKYLNAPEETSLEDRQYQAIIAEILKRLEPGNATRENTDYAFKLLLKGSNYDIDARLCDALADSVYTVWQAQRQQQRLAMANDTMQYEAMQLEARSRLSGTATQNAKDSSEKAKGKRPQGGKGQPPPAPTSGEEEAADTKKAALEAGGWKERRLAEIISRQKGNELKRELSEIQAKVEYQALIVQFFLQRRFQHVLMATRFYRAIFSDGDSKLNVGNETKDIFMKSSGMAPTVSTLDSLANEAVRDVREGVRAFDFLLGKNELDSASKRLGEAFTIGEFITDIRTLPRAKKRQVVDYVHKTNELLAKMESKDFTGAEKIIEDLKASAKDFDATRAKAGIDTARTVSRLHLSKARAAALSGDKETLQAELTAAGEMWPLNPELAEMSQKIFDQGDVMQRAVLDFDQLLSQKNYRRIMDDAARFMAATIQYPDRAAQLKEVIENMKSVDGAIMRADEMKRQSNYPGAWESVEKVAAQFPDDSKLNQARADLTTQAADFVRTLRSAQDMEKRDMAGAALAWFLKAEKLYPASDYAKDGIERLKKAVLPEG
jgi:hypothetical protein